MRILFLTPELPYPPDGGGKIRDHGFISHLAGRHDITIMTFQRAESDDANAGALRKLGCDVRLVPLARRQRPQHKRLVQALSLVSVKSYRQLSYFSPQLQAATDAYLSGHSVDVIHVSHAHMGYAAFPTGVPRVLDAHNVEFEVLRRSSGGARTSMRKLYDTAEYHKFRRDELAICARFTFITSVSPHDCQVLASHVPSARIEVVPNGVETVFYAPIVAAPADEDAIVFTGTIDYYPNTDGVRFFVNDILPLIRAEKPAVKFYVVGKNAPPEIQRYGADPNIIVTGRVDDVRDYLAKAAVVVVPLRIGGGTRLKILEAMAAGRPVVATRVGAEGIAVEDGKTIALADDPAAFAARVIALLDDSAARQRLATEGRALVEDCYDWGILAQRLEQVWQAATR